MCCGGPKPGCMGNKVYFSFKEGTVTYNYLFTAPYNSKMDIYGFDYAWTHQLHYFQNAYLKIKVIFHGRVIDPENTLYTKSWSMSTAINYDYFYGSIKFLKPFRDIIGVKLIVTGVDGINYSGYYGPIIIEPSIIIRYTILGKLSCSLKSY